MPITICGITDFKRKIIPHKITVPAIVAGIIFHLILGEGLIFSLTGGLVAFIVGCLGLKLGGFGGGDVMLATVLGVWLGLYGMYWVVLVGSVIGVIWGIVSIIKDKTFKAKIKQLSMARYGISMLAKLPEDPDAPLPKGVIPFGVCLTLATWLYALNSLIF